MLCRWLDPLLNPVACLPEAPEQQADPERAEPLIKRLDAQLQQRLRYGISGEKRGILKGQGLDFADLREYIPGDDIRKIDWNVFARTLSPHVREYHEEKQLTLWLMLDQSPSMNFGRQKTKLRQAIDLAGLFALLAEKAHYRLGAILLQGQESRIFSPQPGRSQAQAILHSMLEFADRLESGCHAMAEAHAADSFPGACRKLEHLVQKQATVVVLSDFLADPIAWQTPLGQLSRRARMIYLLLSDPVERALPAGLGLLPVIDPENPADFCLLDSNDASFREAYARQAAETLTHRLDWLSKTGAALLADTTEDTVATLVHLLQEGPLLRRPA